MVEAHERYRERPLCTVSRDVRRREVLRQVMRPFGVMTPGSPRRRSRLDWHQRLKPALDGVVGVWTDCCCGRL
jgi:hypothetical protein